MSTDPELDRLLAERDAMLTLWDNATKARVAAVRAECWAEDAYYDALAAGNKHLESLK
jgi:hypothetical protein